MLLVLSLSALLIAAVTAQLDNGQVLAAQNLEWEAFKTEFNKTYLNSSEEADRKQIFLDNLQKILQHNQLNDKTYKLGINQFSDMTKDEFKKMHGLKINSSASVKRREMTSDPSTNNPVHDKNTRDIPKAVDWRNSSCLSPVENQGECGSCWAFATAKSVESIKCIKTGKKVVRLSEQQLVDCSESHRNVGCRGGTFDYTYKYIKEVGLETNAAYPYKDEEGICQLNESLALVKITGYERVPEGKEMELVQAVARQPVAVGVDAEQDDFQFYSEGIYYNKECSNHPDDLSHAVLIVGYGSDENGAEYWIAQNSHGTSWGEQGYMRLARNVDNHCGVASDATYPIYE